MWAGAVRKDGIPGARSCMKFRLVLLGPDEDPDQHPLTKERPLDGPLRAHKALRYEQRGTDIVRVEQRTNGVLKSTPVANFSARIVRDLLLDDGDQQKRHFGLEAQLGGRRVAFVLSAAEFVRMGWVLNKLGPQAIIYPGQQQHARAAIQWLSGEIPQERIFTHLGWRKHGPHWVYLHAGGALGAAGLQPGFAGAVASRFAVIPIAHRRKIPEKLVKRFAQVCVACLWRRTGSASRCWQPCTEPRWGRWISACFSRAKPACSRPPWPRYASSTSEQPWTPAICPPISPRRGMRSKGSGFLCQGRAVGGGRFCSHRKARGWRVDRVAERLFRAAGNQQGRSRLGGNGAPYAHRSRPARWCWRRGNRCLAGKVFAPACWSWRWRRTMWTGRRLSECQQRRTAGTIGRSDGRISELDRRPVRGTAATPSRRGRWRSAARATGVRFMPASRQLWRSCRAAGRSCSSSRSKWVRSAEQKQQELEERSERALGELAALQAKYQQPAIRRLRFVSLLQAALACGHAHVADRAGKAPEEAAVWGWRRNQPAGGGCREGTRIGWIGGERPIPGAGGQLSSGSGVGRDRAPPGE